MNPVLLKLKINKLELEKTSAIKLQNKNENHRLNLKDNLTN